MRPLPAALRCSRESKRERHAGGATWSPLKILHWVENRTRGQPTPVVDNVTGTIFMAFDDNLSGKTTGSTLITSSQDDGQTWSNATAIPKAGGGVITSPNSGLGRGFVIYNASLPSKTRLILPTESGAMYSDDHGASWTLGPPPQGQAGVGENSIARCTPGACGGAPGGSAQFAMVHRGPAPKDPTKSAVGIHFSNDSIHWSAPRPLPGLSRYTNYSQAPGLIATPGGLLLSHGGLGPPPSADGSLRAGHGDSNGADLFSSTDGVTWELARHVWPFTCGYSAMVETSTDASGGALTYALLFEADGAVGAEQMLARMNFTGKP